MNAFTRTLWVYLTQTTGLGQRIIESLIMSPDTVIDGQRLDYKATRITRTLANGWMENPEGRLHRWLVGAGFDPKGTKWRQEIDLYFIVELLAEQAGVKLKDWPHREGRYTSTLAQTYITAPKCDPNCVPAFDAAQLSKEDTMSQKTTDINVAITRKTFLNGNDVNNLSFDGILNVLNTLNGKVKSLKDSAGAKTAAVKKQVASLANDSKAVAAVLDARFGGDEPVLVDVVDVDGTSDMVVSVTYVDGVPATDMDMDAFLYAIERRNKAIATLKDSAGAKTAAVKARITALQADQTSIEKLMDEVLDTDAS